MSDPAKKRGWETELPERPAGAKKLKSSDSLALSQADPLGHLNKDVLHLIGSYLTPKDIVRSERVSERWQAVSEFWLAAVIAKFLKIEPGNPLYADQKKYTYQLNAMGLEKITYADQKQSICRLHSLRGGYSTTAVRLHYDSFLHPFSHVCWRRDFMVQVGPTARFFYRNDGPQPEHVGDNLYWRWYSGSKLPGGGKFQKVPMTRFCTPDDAGVGITHLAANDDGIVLIKLRPGRNAAWERTVVHSLVDDKVLWQDDSHLQTQNIILEEDEVTHLLGQERLYALSLPPFPGWIVARNFRTGFLLYQHRLGRGPLSDSRLACEKARLFQATNGNEIIIVYPAKTTYGPFNIINASNGHHVRSLSYKGLERFDQIRTHPASRRMAIVDTWDYELSLCALKREYPVPSSNMRVTILRYFAYHPDAKYM
ncbi:uncharacterized protein DSM5745_09843 [Aspergillus mulundensis]|uniref:F-box domain-containing protein n=1 Tax=Aspergillus mulundensis TaxID=1810919 RepID=A0A3D8QRL0_9EURO|nr:hypothetical protein DSM5745_09843 [Aspergillus mulundensis]RDW64432.1 hypothetical protein DSM5745_09843 [Aspergillus mulundensis]